MRKILAAAIIILMIALQATACTKKPAEGGAEAASTAPAAPAATAAPTETPLITEAPTDAPTEDPAKAEAIRLAAEHGLNEDDLKGEYGLFIGFCEALEGNGALGEYGEFVYGIFPVIADNADLVDEERLYFRLSRLSIGTGDLTEYGEAGQYSFADWSILLDERVMADDPYKTCPTLFHELMHFLDHSFGGEMLPLYLLDGRRLTPADTAELGPEDLARMLSCIETDFVTEGGAELNTARYYSRTVNSYFKNCAFLTGLEHIYGGEFVRKLFFGSDSDAVFAEALLEAGFSEAEYVSACETLNWLSRPEMFGEPETYFAPEDTLIRLYEYRLGDGWTEDARFIYILRYMNGIALDDYKLSEHADILRPLLFTTWSKYDRFEEKLLACAPEGAAFAVRPPAPFFRDGQLLLSVNANVNGTPGVLVFEYDFESDMPIGCEFTDGRLEYDRAFRVRRILPRLAFCRAAC